VRGGLELCCQLMMHCCIRSASLVHGALHGLTSEPGSSSVGIMDRQCIPSLPPPKDHSRGAHLCRLRIASSYHSSYTEDAEQDWDWHMAGIVC
jgi:hypothetical protein